LLGGVARGNKNDAAPVQLLPYLGEAVARYAIERRRGRRRRGKVPIAICGRLDRSAKNR
jgi:hypothetical protein